MLQTQTATPKVLTDLTCWKCGEETLQQMTQAVDPHAFSREKIAVSAIAQSECTKCGARSVNAVQSRHNKTVGRKNRKAIIKEANRKSG
jgi:formate dehydrogenase assembly factor FdhD